MVYTWEEVLRIQDGKGEKVHLPFIDELDINMKFALTELKLDNINTELLSSLEEFEKYDCHEDLNAVKKLIKAYENNEDVPPIVIDKDNEIIEGYHRLPAQIHIGRNSFKAFKQIV